MLVDPLVPPPRLLEVSHVAHRLSVSAGYVRKLIGCKHLAAIRLGAQWRIDPADLQTFIDRRRQATDGSGVLIERRRRPDRTRD